MINIDVAAAVDRLSAVSRSIENMESTYFWAQLVRDIDGRWSKYATLRSMENTRYFYGAQPHVRHDNPAEVALLQANVKARDKMYSTIETLKKLDSSGFREWLMELRSIMEYRPTEDWKNEIHATTTHTVVVLQDVLPLAKQYRDPYADGSARGPLFTGFPSEALPIDETVDGLIRHTYPSLKFSELYFKAALCQIKAILSKNLSLQEYIERVARIYQLLINLHYFPSINTSLYMNIANGFLEIAGVNGYTALPNLLT